MKISRFDRRLNSPRFQDWCTLCESGGQSNRDTIHCSQLLPAIRKHSFPLQNSISRYYYILLSFSRTTPPQRWIKPWSTSGGGDERSSRRWKQRSVGILRGVSLRRDPKLKVFSAEKTDERSSGHLRRRDASLWSEWWRRSARDAGSRNLPSL